MAKNHGARQQKKLAKQKAKRKEKRSNLMRRDSTDPTIRLQHAEKWPVVRALIGEELWETGIGTAMIARQEGEGRLVFAIFLVDVFCLGVKDAFWQAGSMEDFKMMVEKTEMNQNLLPIEPACLVKIVNGAADFALSIGFRPHKDFDHAALLFQGIDPSTCTKDYTYGKGGKPLYMQGPFDSPAKVESISQRVKEAGGHVVIGMPGFGAGDFGEFDDEDDFEDSNDSEFPPLPERDRD